MHNCVQRNLFFCLFSKMTSKYFSNSPQIFFIVSKNYKISSIFLWNIDTKHFSKISPNSIQNLLYILPENTRNIPKNLCIFQFSLKNLKKKKYFIPDVVEVISNPDISLEFRVFLVNGQTGAHTKESRILRFWFKPVALANEHSTIAQHLFKDLVSPADFPRGNFFFFFFFSKI